MTGRLVGRWVSCSQDDDWWTAQYRHLLVNPLDTLCGSSASAPEVWRGSRAKPECPRCRKVLGTTPTDH